MLESDLPMLLVLDSLSLGHLLDVLVEMLLHQPPLLQKHLTLSPKGLPCCPPHKVMDNCTDKRTVTHQTRTADYGNVDNDRLKPILRYRFTTKVGFRA